MRCAVPVVAFLLLPAVLPSSAASQILSDHEDAWASDGLGETAFPGINALVGGLTAGVWRELSGGSFEDGFVEPEPRPGRLQASLRLLDSDPSRAQLVAVFAPAVDAEGRALPVTEPALRILETTVPPTRERTNGLLVTYLDLEIRAETPPEESGYATLLAVDVTLVWIVGEEQGGFEDRCRRHGRSTPTAPSVLTRDRTAHSTRRTSAE